MGLFDVFKKKIHSDSTKSEQIDKKKKLDPKKAKDLNLKKEKVQPASPEKVEPEKDLTISEITSKKEIKSDQKSSKSKKIDKHDTKNAYRILVKPLVTEKATHLKAENKYLFEVNSSANKSEIKKAIFHVYGTWPLNVHVINVRGKDVRYGKSTGITKSKKKAIVTLKPGESIEIYEGV